MADERIMMIRVQCGHNVWFSRTPTYLFDGDIVKVHNPEYDVCYLGVVIGDYLCIGKKEADITAGTYCQRQLCEVLGKYEYKEFGK